MDLDIDPLIIGIRIWIKDDKDPDMDPQMIDIRTWIQR